MQPVRDNFGPTVINLDTEDPDSNKAVGGSATTQHCKGLTVDIEVPWCGKLRCSRMDSKDNLDFLI